MQHCKPFAPMGDPMELRIHGYELTLRLSDAENIEILLKDDEVRKDNSEHGPDDVTVGRF